MAPRIILALHACMTRPPNTASRGRQKRTLPPQLQGSGLRSGLEVRYVLAFLADDGAPASSPSRWAAAAVAVAAAAVAVTWPSDSETVSWRLPLFPATMQQVIAVNCQYPSVRRELHP